MKSFSEVGEQFAICGVTFDLHTTLAWELIRHFGTVAAKLDGEDTQGRAKLGLQEASELVDRAFSITDRFIETSEKREGIKQMAPIMERAKISGQCDRVKLDESYKRVKDMVETK